MLSTGSRLVGPGARSAAWLAVVLALAVAGSIFAATAIGSSAIPLSGVLGVLLWHVAPALAHPAPNAATADIVWSIRLPRAVLAALVGAALALAGAQMQALFRNPLASPDIVGASSGAALGAVAALATGLATSLSFSLPALAFLGAVLTLICVYFAARHRGRVNIATLILVGIAVNALIGAATSYVVILTASNYDAAQQIVFWLLGSLSGSTWSRVLLTLPFVAISFAVAYALGRDLDLLAVGDRSAGSLGLDVETTKRVALANAALLTGAAVAVSGIVGFVGLVVPHIVRLVVGPAHRRLLPCAAAVGAVAVVLADLAARTLRGLSETPLGIVTAFIGAPFFLFLVLRHRSAEA